MSALDRHELSQRQCFEKQSHTVENIHVRSTRAQQHEKSRLSLSLSFFEVGPCNVVPLMDKMTVLLSDDLNKWPLNPSAVSSHPNGKLYEGVC
jgi:hypothetical protein